MHRRRKISLPIMICLLIMIITFAGYLVYDLTDMYYDTYENTNSNLLVENNNETDKVLNVFGYEFKVPDLEVFTK